MFSPPCFQGRWEIRFRVGTAEDRNLSRWDVQRTCTVQPITRRRLTGCIVVVPCLCCVLSVPQPSCWFLLTVAHVVLSSSFFCPNFSSSLILLFHSSGYLLSLLTNRNCSSSTPEPWLKKWGSLLCYFSFSSSSELKYLGLFWKNVKAFPIVIYFAPVFVWIDSVKINGGDTYLNSKYLLKFGLSE